jgi:hypothetical protein
MSSGRLRLSICAALIAASAATAGVAAADEPRLVHPIYAHLPDTPEDNSGKRAFAAAALRYKLGAVEVVDVPGPAAPHAPEMAKTGVLNAQKIAFGEALRDLDAAASEAVASGGAGFSTDELSDLYLFRAMATARADWKATADAPPTDERTRAYADYLRAAALTPARTLNPRQIPPQVIADFARAVDEVRRRPRGTLTVRGSADAQVALDGGPPMPVKGGISFRDLVNGEHLVRVEEAGHAPWGAAVMFTQPTLDVDIPARAALGLDDATAATHARRMGARFALVAEPKGGPHAGMALRLVDLAGKARDAAMVLGGAETGLLDAAVMRLDESARKIAQADDQAGSPAVVAAAGDTSTLAPPVLISPPLSKARFSEDPAAWARDHWPLLTAVGVVVLSSIILGAAVAGDR